MVVIACSLRSYRLRKVDMPMTRSIRSHKGGELTFGPKHGSYSTQLLIWYQEIEKLIRIPQPDMVESCIGRAPRCCNLNLL